MTNTSAKKLAAVPGPPAPPGRQGERVPIEELARRTGTTVRNLRAFSARGLLDPPELEGRKGFYTERHRARVTLVRRLQDRGFSLSAIGELLNQWKQGGGLMELAGIEDALGTELAPGSNVGAPVGEVFPELLDDARGFARAAELGLCVGERGAAAVAPSAELLRILRDLTRAGIPLEVALDEVANLRADMARVAARFRNAFRTHIDARFRHAGPGELSGLTDAIRRVPAAAVRAATIVLSQAIDQGSPETETEAEPPSRGKKPPRSKAAPGRRR